MTANLNKSELANGKYIKISVFVKFLFWFKEVGVLIDAVSIS
jgi:hypothetical protein